MSITHWNMNQLVVIIALVMCGVHGGCVDDTMTEMKSCFDTLKNNMMSEAPEDVNNFLCSDSQKGHLDCVIEKFKECPEFVNESFINGLKHTATHFHARDLFHVSSADEFCKCAPTFSCMGKVETDKLAKTLGSGPWTKIANQEYICGLGRINIDCVAKSLPTCTDYLQYKHNESVTGRGNEHVDINNLQFAADYADRRCKNWPTDSVDHSCTMKRAGWHSVEICHNQIDHLTKASDKMCGMRTCIERSMFSCPVGEMDYFIDAVNVFSGTKININKCSSSVAISASALTTLVICVLSLLY